MTSTRSRFFIILAFLYLTVPLLANEAVIEDAITVTTTPAHRMNENNKRRGPWWKDRHEEKRALAEQGNWELVFLGDSITHGWERNGQTLVTNTTATEKLSTWVLVETVLSTFSGGSITESLTGTNRVSLSS